MQRIATGRNPPLFDVAATRRIERAAAASLPDHALMERAGLAVARLALALAPHASRIWIACGPGNNGGDGFEAAMHLQRWGKAPRLSWLGQADQAPPAALASLQRARGAGVAILQEPPPDWDFAIDALLGIGNSRPVQGRMADWIQRLRAGGGPVLAVDLPSGLDADSGAGLAVQATHTLSLITLKPGLFTAGGRDGCGELWYDDLGVAAPQDIAPVAVLSERANEPPRVHASHKGSYGDVAVIGGAPGMAGAALLAGSAALHDGAGRVFVALLDPTAMTVDTTQPELMLRPWDALPLATMAVACGCGGGDAIRAVLPAVLSTARVLVLDADALNAVAADAQLQAQLQARARRGRGTVITPHPLEAARLLGRSTGEVQANRIAAANELAQRFGSVAVLKGSGTITAAPGQVPVINSSGNGKLATAGTGDVLAGMIAARLARGEDVFPAAHRAVQSHGDRADRWPDDLSLTASRLAGCGDNPTIRTKASLQ